MKCKNCFNNLKRKNKIYCDNKCQQNFQYKKYIKRWFEGKESGGKYHNTVISNHVRRYLEKQKGCKCWKCGWNKINIKTKKVPVEVDHIDGNHSNNRPENLRLLCPNCHSLTSNFRGLNKGNGRELRRRNSIGRVTAL